MATSGFSSVLAQPVSPGHAMATATVIAMVRYPNNPLGLLSSIVGAPLRTIRRPQPHELLEQLIVTYSGRTCGFCEILRSFEGGVGVGVQHVHLSVRPDAKVHPRIT